MEPEQPLDPQELDTTTVDVSHSRFRRMERLATTQRRQLQLATVKPEPPRGVKLSSGTASWEEPHETRNVTHYNIYTPDENTLERRVPSGQTKATAINAAKVFISSFNTFTELESAAIMADDSFVAEIPGGGGSGTEFVDLTGYIFTATQSPDTGESGTQEFRLRGDAHFSGTAPENYGGVRIIARVDSRAGYVWLADLTKDQISWESTAMPKMVSAMNWRIYALLRNTTGSSNLISDPGSTPAVDINVAKTTGSLDLSRAATTSYNTTHFQITGGAFSLKELPGSLITGNINTTGTITASGYAAGASTGVDFSGFFVSNIALTNATLNYKDHAGNNATMSVVTFVTPTIISKVWTKGLLTF